MTAALTPAAAARMEQALAQDHQERLVTYRSALGVATGLGQDPGKVTEDVTTTLATAHAVVRLHQKLGLDYGPDGVSRGEPVEERMTEALSALLSRAVMTFGGRDPSLDLLAVVIEALEDPEEDPEGEPG